MFKKFALVLLALVVALAAAPSFAKAASNDAMVYVVHGIPGPDGLPVDVSVNGACAVPGFTFSQILGPLPFAAGTYTIAISLADPANPCGGPVVIGPVDVPFAAGENATVIAYLTEDGQPTAGKFLNDVSRTGRGSARIIAHHTAAAPSVDIWIGRDLYGGSAPRIMVSDFINGEQVKAQVRPGEWQLAIAPNGSPDPVFGPVTIELQPFYTYLVYAVGSVSDGTFTLLIKPVSTRMNMLPVLPVIPTR